MATFNDLTPENEQDIRPLREGLNAVEVSVGETWVLLPQLANRKHIIVRNSKTSEVKLSHSNSLGYVGFPLDKKQAIALDVSSELNLYARSENGTVTLYILEIA